MKGIQESGGRILIGRLQLEREADRITNISLGDISDAAEKLAVKQADFTAHLNPPGTRVDLGAIATNGSVKVNRGSDSLTVFPYPRDREFGVALDLKAIAPEANIDPSKATVRALAALTQEDMGEVEATVEGDRLTFQVGLQGAGRYVVSW